MATRNHEQRDQKNKNPMNSTPALQLPMLNFLTRPYRVQKNVDPKLFRVSAQHVSPMNSPPAVPSLNFPLPMQLPYARRSQKLAVLCGVSYGESKFKLKGTVSDVKNIRELLISRFGYPKEYIRVLTEEEPDPKFHPTKENILNSLRWLVKNNHSGDSLVFFYSGHSIQQRNFNGDEEDGFDETICPCDFLKEGMILDDELNSILVNPLKRGVKLHAIVDSRHTGTNFLDLPYMYDRKTKMWRSNKPPLSGAYNKGTLGGLAISISACTDNNQKASETSAFTGKMNGALTYILVHLLQTFPGPTYGDLFNLMEEVIDDVNNKGNVLQKMFSSKLSQTPILSSSAEFDLYQTHIQL